MFYETPKVDNKLENLLFWDYKPSEDNETPNYEVKPEITD